MIVQLIMFFCDEFSDEKLKWKNVLPVKQWKLRKKRENYKEYCFVTIEIFFIDSLLKKWSSGNLASGNSLFVKWCLFLDLYEILIFVLFVLSWNQF